MSFDVYNFIGMYASFADIFNALTLIIEKQPIGYADLMSMDAFFD